MLNIKAVAAAILASVGLSSASYATEKETDTKDVQVKCGTPDASGFVQKCPPQGLSQRIQIQPLQGAVPVISPHVIEAGYRSCTDAYGRINRDCLSSYFLGVTLAQTMDLTNDLREARHKCPGTSSTQAKLGCEKK